MTYLETTPAFARHLDPEKALDFVDNPRATRATLELWYSSFSEGERQLLEQEILSHEYGAELFWLNLHTVFRNRMTLAEWVESIQKNQWHRSKRRREKRARN